MMWVITVYLKENRTTMFEFNSESEAKEAFRNIHGCKILTEVINYHNPSYPIVAV